MQLNTELFYIYIPRMYEELFCLIRENKISSLKSVKNESDVKVFGAFSLILVNAFYIRWY